MSEKKKESPHKCAEPECATLTYYLRCARCDNALNEARHEARRQKRERYASLSSTWRQAQDEQEMRWGKKDE
jgi:hypothetical protein